MPKEQLPIFLLALAWCLREIYGYFKDGKSEHSKAIKDSTSEMHKLTLTLVELTVEIRNLKETAKHIPKIQQDLHFLHARVRDIDPKYKRNGRSSDED